MTSQNTQKDAARHDPYAVLRVRDFRLLLTGRFITSFGGEMLTFAIAWELWLRTKSAFALGMVGKWAIHPSQVDLAAAVFTPDPAAVAAARAQKQAYQEATARGLGAINVDGVMVDAASVRIVQNLIDRADLIGM